MCIYIYACIPRHMHAYYILLETLRHFLSNSLWPILPIQQHRNLPVKECLKFRMHQDTYMRRSYRDSLKVVCTFRIFHSRLFMCKTSVLSKIRASHAIKYCNFSRPFPRTLAFSHFSAAINVIPRGGMEESGHFRFGRKYGMSCSFITI